MMKWPTNPTTINSSGSFVNIQSEGKLGLAMLHVIQSTTIEVGDVIVVKAIDLSALFARAHQPHLPQAAHLMRHCRLADTCRFGQYADIHLPSSQNRSDPYPAHITQSPEQFDHIAGGAFVEGG